MSTQTLDPANLRDNQFVGKTRSVPRPTAEDRAYQWSGGAADLVRDRARWDFAAAWQADNDRLRAERLAGLDARREATRQALAVEADGRFVDHLRQGYFAADPTATEAEFAADLPRIRRDLRVQAATAGPAGPAPRPVRGGYGI